MIVYIFCWLCCQKYPIYPLSLKFKMWQRNRFENFGIHHVTFFFFFCPVQILESARTWAPRIAKYIQGCSNGTMEPYSDCCLFLYIPSIIFMVSFSFWRWNEVIGNSGRINQIWEVCNSYEKQQQKHGFVIHKELQMGCS